MPIYREFLCDGLAYVGLAIVCGVVVLAACAGQGCFRGLLPRQRERAVPWGGLEVFTLAFLWQALQVSTAVLLIRTGFFSAVYGADYSSALLAGAPEGEHALRDARISLWGTAASFPLEILLILGFLGVTRGVLPYQLGWTAHRWRKDLALGYIGWLLVMPCISALNYLVNWLYALGHGGKVEEHALVQLLTDPSSPLPLGDWIAAFILAFLAAPFVEEMLFRGVIQRWVVRRAWSADLIIALSFIIGLAGRYDKVQAGLQLGLTRDGVVNLLDGFSPALFVLAMIPGYAFAERLAWRWIPTPNAARGIYATALLFAMVHYNVWPSPIPLFPFALSLGFIAYRTQSLLGPILMHSLFDGVSAITLVLLSLWPNGQPVKGSPETSASKRPAAVSTVTAVPAASEPRLRYPNPTAAFNRGETAADVIRPTSAPSRKTLAPPGGTSVEDSFNPRRDQFTWPRSRARTIGSWPGKQPFL